MGIVKISMLAIILLSVSRTTSLKSTRPFSRKALNLLTLVLTYSPLAKAATKWALSDDATVLQDANWYSPWNPDLQIVTGQAFKSFYHSVVSSVVSVDREIWLDLGSS